MPIDATSERPPVDVEAPRDGTASAEVRRGEGLWLLAGDWTSAARLNGLGLYEDALTAAERAAEAAAEHPPALGFSTWVLPELVEAGVRSGRAERAAAALRELTAIARAAGTDWALGLEARARALLREGEAAERLYREAIERLARTTARAALARARLLYGEWLRRERRRTDAREQLRVAQRVLAELDMEEFAERARRELVATGQTARRRAADTVDELTAQEAQIARLAGDGHTNPEIGEQLFISPRTVEWHLRKVFPKLGISSRRQLRRALPEPGRAALRS
jgi:ATP/maltotriose-dependent transcriptional regulator MalT